MRKIWLGLFLALLALPAYGQTTVRPCVTISNAPDGCPPVSASTPMPVTLGGSGGGPLTGTTTPANSTIAVTNTFQNILAASSSRKGCSIQNQGTHVMYFFFNPIAGASTAKSKQVLPGQEIYCSEGPIVVTDEVNVTGTAGDAYVVNSQ